MKTLTLFVATILNLENEKQLTNIKLKEKKNAYSCCFFIDEDINSSKQITAFNTRYIKTIASSIDTNETLSYLTEQALLVFLSDVKKESPHFQKLKIMTDILSLNQIQTVVNLLQINNYFSIIDMNLISKTNNLLAYQEIEKNILLNKYDCKAIQNKINLLYESIKFYKSVIKNKDEIIDNLQFKSDLDNENIRDLLEIIQSQNKKGDN